MKNRPPCRRSAVLPVLSPAGGSGVPLAGFLRSPRRGWRPSSPRKGLNLALWRVRAPAPPSPSAKAFGRILRAPRAAGGAFPLLCLSSVRAVGVLDGVGWRGAVGVLDGVGGRRPARFSACPRPPPVLGSARRPPRGWPLEVERWRNQSPILPRPRGLPCLSAWHVLPARTGFLVSHT